MEKENDYVQKIHELEQELKIRIEDNAELYTKLCNALMQIEEANKVIKIYGTPIYIERHRDEKCIVTEKVPYTDTQPAEQYLKKWGVQ